jgi:glutaredoxin
MRLLQRHMIVALFFILTSFVSFIAPHVSLAEAPVAANSRLPVYVFWTAKCPHCTKAVLFMEQLVSQEPRLQLVSLELTGQGDNERAFISISERFGVDPPAVPIIIVGGEIFVGYDQDETSGQDIARKARDCLTSPCGDPIEDIVAEAKAGASQESVPARPPQTTVTRPSLPESFWLPIIGEIPTASLSLPALTIVLAAIDGFNPCAMWVLVFLIGLLVGLNDPVRMWSYGAVFLLTSAAVYFAFLAAWLNLFLFLGSLVWIRIAVGIFAMTAGAYYLREFVRNPDGACPVGSPGQKQRLQDRLRTAVAERSFIAAVFGIIVLAIAVNMIELLCSAGIPAIYTQVLALSDLSPAAHYGYLLLYVAVFLLDDAIVFVTAMLTLQAAGLAATYARYSHLLGGVVLLILGLLLVLRPEWLSFA